MAFDVTTNFYRFGARVARSMPGPIGLPVARAAGFGAGRVANAQRRVIVERNLRRILGDDLDEGELSGAVDRTFEYYARYWYESFRLPELSTTEIDAGFDYRGFDHIQGAIDVGRCPLLVMPHLGGWEWAAFWLALVPKLKVSAVVEELEPPELFEFFADFRRSLGMDVIPLGPDAGTSVLSAIRANHVLCLLTDRWVDGSFVEVEFFGEVTRLPAGPATLALRSGAALIPVAVYFENDGHHYAETRPPVPSERQGRLRDDVQRITQALAVEMELLIRAAPEQWHVMTPNWPSDYTALGLEPPY